MNPADEPKLLRESGPQWKYISGSLHKVGEVELTDTVKAMQFSAGVLVCVEESARAGLSVAAGFSGGTNKTQPLWIPGVTIVKTDDGYDLA